MTDDTLLLRQIHPSWIQDGRVTSQAFRPTLKDDDKLSVYDGDQISPKDSFLHFTGDLGHDAIGTQAVETREATAESLSVVPDPEPFPQHVVIGFHGLTNSQKTKAGKVLRAKAAMRGWLHTES